MRHAAGCEKLRVLGKEAPGPKERWVDTVAASLLSHQVREDFLQSFEIVGPESMDVPALTVGSSPFGFHQ